MKSIDKSRYTPKNIVITPIRQRRILFPKNFNKIKQTKLKG
jgi:hypothetical protein